MKKNHVKAMMNNERKTAAATIMEIIEPEMGKNGSVIFSSLFCRFPGVLFNFDTVCSN